MGEEFGTRTLEKSRRSAVLLNLKRAILHELQVTCSEGDKSKSSAAYYCGICDQLLEDRRNWLSHVKGSTKAHRKLDSRRLDGLLNYYSGRFVGINLPSEDGADGWYECALCETRDSLCDYDALETHLFTKHRSLLDRHQFGQRVIAPCTSNEDDCDSVHSDQSAMTDNLVLEEDKNVEDVENNVTQNGVIHHENYDNDDPSSTMSSTDNGERSNDVLEKEKPFVFHINKFQWRSKEHLVLHRFFNLEQTNEWTMVLEFMRRARIELERSVEDKDSSRLTSTIFSDHKYLFECTPCRVTYRKVELWLDHFHTMPHHNNVYWQYKRTNCKKGMLVMCRVCSLIVYGPLNQVRNHDKTRYHLEHETKRQILLETQKTMLEKEKRNRSVLATNSRTEGKQTIDEKSENSLLVNGVSEDSSEGTKSEGSAALVLDDTSVLHNMFHLQNISETLDAQGSEVDVKKTENGPRRSSSVEDKNRPAGKTTGNVSGIIEIKGVPPSFTKTRDWTRTTLSEFGPIVRVYSRRKDPSTICVVLNTGYDETYESLWQNIDKLRNIFGSDAIVVESKKKNYDCGMRTELSMETVELLKGNGGAEKMVALAKNIRSVLVAEGRRERFSPRIKNLRIAIASLARSLLGENVEVRTHIFGSRVTGLANYSSDVDIYIQIADSFRGWLLYSNYWQQCLVHHFSQRMKDFPRDYRNVVPIPFARVPIVTFYHLPSNTNCDLSFKSGLGIMNSCLVKMYFDMDPRVKLLVLAVKHWMNINDLADRNLFTTYAQIWMVLFFLMQPTVLVIPPIQELRAQLNAQLFIDGWDCSFPRDTDFKWRSRNSNTVEHLLIGFFEFYSNIKLDDYVLSTLTGLKLIKRSFLSAYSALPPVYTHFKVLMFNDQETYNRVQNDFIGLCVQDPFDHSHNLTKTINGNKHQAFAALCRETFKLLTGRAN